MLEFDAITSQEIPQDSSLNQLQGQIKNVMIPLLIKIFQLRLEVQQTNSPLLVYKMRSLKRVWKN